IFSFGAVCYEMLSGKRAFEGESAVEILNTVLNSDPPEFAVWRLAVPPALERIVRHCIAKAPEERFQSASDLTFALEAITGQSLPAQVAIPAKTYLRPRRTWSAFLPAAFLSGVLITFIALRATTPIEQHAAAETLFAQITKEPGAELFPSLSPDGRS